MKPTAAIHGIPADEALPCDDYYRHCLAGAYDAIVEEFGPVAAHQAVADLLEEAKANMEAIQ